MSGIDLPVIKVTSTGTKPIWPFAVGLLIGVIAGALIFANVASDLDLERIHAGHFEANGSAYQITPEAK